VKRFLLWLAIAVCMYGGLSLPYHAYLRANPRRVAVGVDTSFEMAGFQERVARELERISSTRYSQFSLLTDKLKVHGWQERLESSSGVSYYGPRDLSALIDTQRFPELSSASRIVILTNALDTSPLKRLPRVKVILLR